MLTLMILRHAKSSWDDPKLDDFSRPLAPRGIKAAPKIGASIQRLDLTPDLILCSTAMRAKSTLGLIMPHLDGETTIMMQDELYHIDVADALLDHVQAQDDRHKSVMLIGHNPVLQDLALMLVHKGTDKDLSQLAEKFPTAALAVIRFKTDHWSRIGKDGRLERLLLPRELG